MTGHEILEKIAELKGDNRGKVLGALIDSMSAVSQNTLNQWQDKFMADNPEQPPFEVYAKEQNKQILEMIKLEASEPGRLVREALGLEPFDLDADYGGATHEASPAPGV